MTRVRQGVKQLLLLGALLLGLRLLRGQMSSSPSFSHSLATQMPQEIQPGQNHRSVKKTTSVVLTNNLAVGGRETDHVLDTEAMGIKRIHLDKLEAVEVEEAEPHREKGNEGRVVEGVNMKGEGTYRMVLATIPRSGNGWLRGLIEAAIGIATESVFPEGSAVYHNVTQAYG